MADYKKAKKDDTRFGGHFDLGVKHPKGMEEDENKFMGTITDMGTEHPEGMESK